MRKLAVFLFSIGAAILITACSSFEKYTSISEIVLETAESTTEIVTEAAIETTTAVTVTKSIETLPVCEVISISREDISDYYFDGETQTIGDDIYGYLEIPAELKYYEPFERIEASIMYVDNAENIKNSVSMYNFSKRFKDADEQVECYNYKKYYSDVKIIKYDVDGYTVYKITYSTDRTYISQWIFECEDGVNRSVKFSGSEDFINMSDNIIKTYNLYN